MKSRQQKKSLDRFIYESMGEKQYLISCLDDDLFKKALKGFRKECPEIDSKTNGFRMCLEALQASELFTEISFIDLHGTKFPLFRKKQKPRQSCRTTTDKKQPEAPNRDFLR